MSYDFSKMTDRRGSNSLKWNIKEDELPMWVADMDFKTAPEITAAIQKKVEKGIYGYTIVPDEWYQAVSGWWDRRHNFKIEKDWLIFSTGVVPAISSVIRKLTTVAENVVVQTPVYNIFFNSIVNNGRHVLENKLIFDGKEYKVDFEDLEYEYIPFASVSEKCRKNSVSCLAPSKAFNLAGIHTAAVVVPDQALRHRVDRGLNTDEVAEPNIFAVEAAVAAFESGEEWLNQLRIYLKENKKIAGGFLENELPDLYLLPAHATYLLWIDCSAITQDTEELCDFIRAETGLYLSAGKIYGGDGRKFVRMNIACPRERLKDGLQRFKKAVKLYKNV